MQLGVKRPRRVSDHSSPSSAEVKNGGAIPPLPYTSSWRGVSLIKHRDTFTFIFANSGLFPAYIGILPL
jgi:hypothetical protein